MWQRQTTVPLVLTRGATNATDAWVPTRHSSVRGPRNPDPRKGRWALGTVAKSHPNRPILPQLNKRHALPSLLKARLPRSQHPRGSLPWLRCQKRKTWKERRLQQVDSSEGCQAAFSGQETSKMGIKGFLVRRHVREASTTVIILQQQQRVRWSSRRTHPFFTSMDQARVWCNQH